MDAQMRNPAYEADKTAARGRDEAARVKIGASAGTAPELLYFLAGDPAVTVRAAVAMNPAAPPQVDTVLATDADERVRMLLARRLATLTPELSGGERDRLRQQAYETLSALVVDEAVRVRAAIADVVKDMPRAPRELILRLAHDAAVAVSDPVIRLSPLLTTEDLLALLAAAPSPATAVAVARRPGITECVSDAIAATANTAAIGALLANTSAAIREATLDALIARASEHTDWHEPLIHRPALPPRAARALSDIVTTQLLATLSARADLDPALAAELRQRVNRHLAPDNRPAAPSRMGPEQAMAEARALKVQGKLTEALLLDHAKRAEDRMASALLAVASDVPLSVVERAASLRSAKGIVSLVWKAGFTMAVATPLQSVTAKLAPTAILPPGPGGTFPLAIEEMRWQIDFLTRMGR